MKMAMAKKKRKSKKNEETLQPVRIIYSIVYRVYAQVKKAYHLNDHLFLISRYAYRTKVTTNLMRQFKMDTKQKQKDS